MYWSQLNEERQIAFWVMDGPVVAPSEWDLHFADMRTVAAWGRKKTVRPAVMLCIGHLFVPPDAVRRKQLAELTSAPGYNCQLAIITGNPLLRSVLTAIQWLRKASANDHEAQFFGDGGQGRVWLESQRGESLPELRQMFNRAPVEAVGKLW